MLKLAQFNCQEGWAGFGKKLAAGKSITIYILFK